MWKRPTRKKLFKELENIQRMARHRPVNMVIIYFSDGYGGTTSDMERLWRKDETILKLMDLSLQYRVVNVSSSDFGVSGKGTIIRFTVMPDKECQTNIDGEFMEQIMGMKFNGE